MNIAILINNLSVGGAERAACFLGDVYSEKGANIYYFFLNRSGRKQYPCKYRIIELNDSIKTYTKLDTIEDLFRSAKRLKRLKKRYAIDVCISFMEECNAINVLSRVSERCVISVRTTLSARKELKGLLYDTFFISSIYNKADRVVAVSVATAHDLIKNYHIKEKKISVISNPAIIHKALDTNERKWIYGEKAVICVGRLDPVKQHDVIIGAFSCVAKANDKSKLIVLGSGKLERYLKALCKKRGVEDRVYFEGSVSDPEWYMQHSRVFVMASRAEGFPNAMVEAMACGLPVVTTDSPGGCGEIVGKTKDCDKVQYCKYGVLVPDINRNKTEKEYVERSEMLCNAILAMLNDDDLYKEYCKASTERAKYYSAKRIVRDWDEVIGWREDI